MHAMATSSAEQTPRQTLPDTQVPVRAAILPQKPAIGFRVLELARPFWEAGSLLPLGPLLARLPRGDGHSVMTLPGFLGADGVMGPLRRFLSQLDYRPLPWGLGRNLTVRSLHSMQQVLDLRERMEAAVATVLAAEVERSGARVSLVGWSLGGLYAAGLAHRHPELLRQVITLGTPYGDPRGSSIYPLIRRIYPAQTSEADLREWTARTFAGELQVPVTALFSRSDGVVGSGIARLPEHELTENIEVMASHVGFPFNPLVRAVLAERLAQPEGHWRPWSLPSLKPFVRCAGHPGGRA